jgi:hypothetical protein
MLLQMEMLARDRQAKLLEEAAEVRTRRLTVGRTSSSVHPERRLPRPSFGRR